MNYQGIIFDFNGVLLWDGHLQERAWARFSREKRGVPFSQEEMGVHVHSRNNQHTIATAAEKTNLDFFVRHLDLTRWFKIDQIVFDDGNRPGKPALDIYLQAAHNLGLPPARCIVVEDSLSGIQAAHAAGIGHIIAMGTHHTHSVLLKFEGVHDVVENLGQISREKLFASKKAF
jgi:beta-phosphoglucomutase-like phosphatase (HAD superfamily)